METNTIDIDSEEKTIIKHIVCSGGGVTGFAFYGAIKESYNRGEWKLENIQSIYGTSVGSIFAVILSLQYDWKTLDDYLIKRPWQNVFKFNVYSIFESLQKRGIFDQTTIIETFRPLFNGKDLSIDITMKELYEFSKYELHLFATEINSFEIVDISYKTHPDWKVVDAVYSSCAIPIIFSPFEKNNKYYCDGAVLLNYPISKCIENGANVNEILGLRHMVDTEKNNISTESSLLDYVIVIFKKIIGSIVEPLHQIENEYQIYSPSISIYDILNTTSDTEERKRLIQVGIDIVASKYSNI